MATNMVFDLVDPPTLLDYVRQYDNEVLYNQFTLQQWFPYHETPDLEWRIRTGTWKDVDTAEYRAYDTPAAMTGRQGFSRLRGELAPVSRAIPLGEEEMLRLRALQSGDETEMIDQIYADAERMTRSVQARLELARGQVLTTGKFTLAENGLVMEADYGMPANHKITAALPWSTSSTDMLADLLTWHQFYVDETGVEAGIIQMSRKILGYAINNQKMRDAAAFAGTTPSRINIETVDAIFAANGLPPVVLYDTKVRVNGVQTSVIPDDKLLFLPPPGEALGTTEYGITAEAIKLRTKGLIKNEEMPGIVAFILENDHPVQTVTAASAIATPVLGNPELIICADVIP